MHCKQQNNGKKGEYISYVKEEANTNKKLYGGVRRCECGGVGCGMWGVEVWWCGVWR